MGNNFVNECVRFACVPFHRLNLNINMEGKKHEFDKSPQQTNQPLKPHRDEQQHYTETRSFAAHKGKPQNTNNNKNVTISVFNDEMIESKNHQENVNMTTGWGEIEDC